MLTQGRERADIGTQKAGQREREEKEANQQAKAGTPEPADLLLQLDFLLAHRLPGAPTHRCS